MGVHKLSTVDFHKPRHSLVEDIEVQWENIVDKKPRKSIELFTPEQPGRQENMLFREQDNFTWVAMETTGSVNKPLSCACRIS